MVVVLRGQRTLVVVVSQGPQIWEVVLRVQRTWEAVVSQETLT